MQMVAESWLVFRLTGSSALLGLSAFAGQIPVFLFAPIGGAVADRFNRHRIIVVTQSVSMVLPLILAALTLSGRVRVWHVFVLAMSLGIVNAFDIPARQAFVVDMVGRDDLLNAIALNSSMVNGAHSRTVGGGAHGRRRRRRLVLSHQRCQLPRGHRGAADDAGAANGATAGAPLGAPRHDRRLSVRRAHGPRPRAAGVARPPQLRR